MNYLNETARMLFAGGALILVALLSTPNIDSQIAQTTPRSISEHPLNKPIKELQQEKNLKAQKSRLNKNQKKVSKNENKKSKKEISLKKS
jgi:hypothetical protein